jgi:outer membrane receptor protein involved in Fe transport
MDLGANYTIDRFEFSFNVHNLLNRRYSLSGACTGLIPQQGRWFMGTVAVKL